MTSLEKFSGAPKLYFAVTHSSHSYIGMQYCIGKPLTEFVQKLNTTSIDLLANCLKSATYDLHNNYGYVHGDMSPKNILVQEEESDWKVSFIDWECSRPLRDQTIESYSKFQGTIGYGDLEQNPGLLKKDLQAIDDCILFLNPNHRAQSGGGTFSWTKGLRAEFQKIARKRK